MESQHVADRVKNAGTVIELGGNRYVMPPLSIGVIEQFGDDQMAMLTGATLEPKRMTFLVDLIFGALKRNYPELDRAVVSEGCDFGNIAAVMKAMLATDALATSTASTPENAADEAN